MAALLVVWLATQPVPPVPDEGDFDVIKLSFAAHSRVSFPSGEISDGGVRYEDNFDPAVGIAVEADLLYPMGVDWWRIGPYASGSYDSFDGESFTDGAGNTADPDRMDIVTLLAGVKSRQALGPYAAVEGRLGLGAARYEPVSATLVFGGVRREGQEFFEQSIRPAFEFAGRFEFGSPAASITLGMGFLIIGGPDEGDDSDPFLDPDDLWLFTLDAGFTFRF